MKNKKSSFQKIIKLRGDELEGTVIATFGANAEIEDAVGKVIRCYLRKNMDPVVTGDRVLWQEETGQGIIVAHLPRTSLMYKPESQHKNKLIAANVDLIVIVTSPPPILSLDMIDRYLVAAENLNIQPLILMNKMDLVNDAQEMEQLLSEYIALDYPVLFCSAKTQDGIKEVSKFFENKNCVLVGASGVGKSSIIACLTDSHSISIGSVSNNGLGKHTTTTTRLYHIPSGGTIIDSPGVREFGLGAIDEAQLQKGFKEFAALKQKCKFRDCHHQKEPDCALQNAIRDKEISERRFASYLKILASLKAHSYR